MWPWILGLPSFLLPCMEVTALCFVPFAHTQLAPTASLVQVLAPPSLPNCPRVADEVQQNTDIHHILLMLDNFKYILPSHMWKLQEVYRLNIYFHI